MTRIDKRDRASLFRARLAQAMTNRSMTQSGLARAIYVDRSTISQLLHSDGPRLPNAQVVGECAAKLGVSADWLLGLSDYPEQAADILAMSMSVTQAPRALVDAQIFAWHQEAAGYKIRHVPAGLPDMLKTHDMLSWEYAPHLGRSTQQAIGASQDRLNWMRSMRSDYEIAIPVHEMRSFARAEGYYSELPLSIRQEQLEHILSLQQQLYPTLRMFLFDARRIWSAPITVFGPLLSVLYVGRHYFAFRDAQKIQDITRHFDGLVRECQVADREVPEFIQNLIDDL